MERSLAELEAGLAGIVASPADVGHVRLMVRRPASGQREVVDEAALDPDAGLVGDDWSVRGSKRTPDGSSDREAQVTLMNSRVAELLAGEPERWAAAGDQLYVDMDLSEVNVPSGTLLRIGSAVMAVSATPHTGCAKFAARFGPDALRFVSSPVGRALRLRGLNTTVVESGIVRTGDAILKR